MSSKKLCSAVEERLAEAIDGTLEGALAEHAATCDECRDRIHDATFVIDEIRGLSGDFAPSPELEDRILAALDERAARAGGSVEKPDAPAAAAAPLRLLPRLSRRAGVALALAAAMTIGLASLRGRGPGNPFTASTAAAPWRGVVTRVAGPEGGLLLEDASGVHAAKAGDVVPAGAKLRTDVRTRARITLDDGTFLLLDRGAEVALDSHESRSAKLVRGSAVVDATASETQPAKLAMPGGSLTTQGAKLALSALGDGATVAVARGKASIGTDTLGVGEGALFGGGGAAPVIRAGGLGPAFGWSDAIEEPIKVAGEEASVPGLGVLRAKVPGAAGDGDRPLDLVRQTVNVKIAGDFARTEIEEVFSSDFEATQAMEGIFRFPLPPDAAIERLALDVDGKVEEGAFVDKDKGQAIWKGVMLHAQPKPQPKPQDEWIWVPGPWRDPALLEWRAGGRMELRVFPIPPKGSRRVILAYTQRIAAVAGARRYVYPLPRFGGAQKPIADFTLDVQVAGHDPQKGLSVAGYETEQIGDARRTLHKTAFLPSGDFVLELAPKDQGVAAKSWSYKPAGGEAAFVALSLSPSLPRAPDATVRTHALVLDSSRSMIGERWARASALAARVVEEMDTRDRFTLYACDVSCQPLSVSSQPAGKKSADAVRTFLAGVVPEGASDPVAALKVASAHLASEPGRVARVIYVGDGAATLGARTPAALEAGARSALGEATLTAVAIGSDADLPSLDAMARGGGGVVIPFVAGQPLSASALDVLEASYGVTLRDPQLALPPGLTAVAPTRLGAVRAGGELLVVARMSGGDVSGEATLTGTLGGKPFRTTIPIAVKATSDAGNAFVPRVWASETIADLERTPGVDRARIVELSKAFAVPSRHTSLLVLESPAMASAFGVEPRKRAYEWTGDAVPVAESAAVAEDEAGGGSGYGIGLGHGFGGFGSGGKAGGAYKDASGADAPAAMPAPVAKSKAAPKMDMSDDWAGGGGGGGSGSGRWVRMRREWFRTVSFASGAEADLESKIAAARSAVVSAPDSRDKLEALFGLVARRESLEEARTVMSSWTSRDPLDVPATLRRSELAAREGDRARALRTLTGVLDGKPDDVGLADGIAEVALRAGDARLACALYAVHAEARPGDVDAVARRVACLRDSAESAQAAVALEASAPDKRAAVEARVLALVTAWRTPKAAPAFGDLTVDATFSGADVDLALVDPKGARLSWLSPTGVRVSDAQSASHETLAVPWAGGGGWTIEVNRAQPGDAPISGTVTVRVLGETRSYPFVLTGARAVVARTNLTWSSRMVAVNDWE